MIENYKDKMMGLVNGYKKKIAGKALDFGIRNNPDMFFQRVSQMIDIELKRQGIIHCQYCNSKSQLLKVGDDYVCRTHYDLIKKAGKQNG